MSDTETPINGGSSGRPRRICATDQLDGILLAQDPGYRSRRQAVEQFSRLSQTAPSLRTGQAHIPVVVHVVHNTDEQNIDINQINEQIRVLNEDFNAGNPDLATLQPVWTNLIGNPNIRFFLAKRDANGQPTEGVTRTPTNIREFDLFSDDLDQRMKFTARGGKDGWPSDRYLNLWVCRMGGDNAPIGYATFPAMGPPKEDGVVIDYRYFGVGGTATEPYHLGRSASHEIGHWLNLRHIWGDDQSLSVNLRCSRGDLCNDTPNQAVYNFGKTTFPHISCGNGPNGDLFRNYMDYSDDDICVMFTKGQVSRMDATLAGPRASLLGSNFTEIRMQSKTSLPEMEKEPLVFLSAAWANNREKDMIVINKNNLELQVLSAASGFQENVFTRKSIGFKADSNDAELSFAIGTEIVNGKPDLFVFQHRKNNDKTDVTILSGESNYEKSIFKDDIALSEPGSSYEYAVARWDNDPKAKPDLIAIKKPSQPTDSYSVGITVLSGASGFKSVLADTTSAALDSTAGTLDFAITDWNGDGIPDLVAIKKSNTSKRPTEVSVLSGVSGFKDLILKTATALNGTDRNFSFLVGDWTGDGRPDLVGIKKWDTQSKGVEIHVMAG